MRYHIRPSSRSMGSMSWSMEDHQLAVGTTELKPPEGLAS